MFKVGDRVKYNGGSFIILTIEPNYIIKNMITNIVMLTYNHSEIKLDKQYYRKEKISKLIDIL